MAITAKDGQMQGHIDAILESPEVRSVLARLATSGKPAGSAWEAMAESFARSVASTREPEFVNRSNAQAARFTKNSFSKLNVNGLDDTLGDGRTVADYLRSGGVIVFRNHQSYAGFVCDKLVYAEHEIDNVTFIAGSNIVNLKDRKKAAEWREQLTRTGVKMVERNPPQGREGMLYFTELGVSIRIDLSEGGNITIYGNGREKNLGREASLKTALISFFLEHGRFVLPVAESYEVILDDEELAYATTVKGGGASFDTLLSLERSPERGEAPCGEFYLNFGQPIPTGEYGRDKQSMRYCEDNVGKLATRLVTLSSTYLLASVVKGNGLGGFSVGQATDFVGALLARIQERNKQYFEDGVSTRVFIAPKLSAQNLSGVVRDAAGKLASRGAFAENGGVYRVEDPVMLDFYAGKGDAPLRAHGIPVAEKA